MYVTTTTRKTKRVEEEEEKEKEGQHCTSTCQYATKIKCVCGCGGVNHGIKSMVKMDAFFGNNEEEQEVEVAAAEVETEAPVPVEAAALTAKTVFKNLIGISCPNCNGIISKSELVRLFGSDPYIPLDEIDFSKGHFFCCYCATEGMFSEWRRLERYKDDE